MRLTEHEVRALAEQLWSREKDGRPGPPLIRAYPGLDVDDAYRVQREGIALRRGESGALVVGHKIGATSLVVQDLFGVETPDFGHLTDDMVVDDNARIDTTPLIAPRVEAEIAFLLGASLRGPKISVRDVLTATHAVVPALEIIDTRITDWDIAFVDTVADNGSAAKVVLGERFVRPDALDLRTVGVFLEINGVVRETGAGAASLGHPAHAVAWLARALARYDEGLDKGHIILSGSLTGAPPVAPGDRVTACFDRLGPVRCSFG
ncbi:2-keto-4-pentenoate hydratase [Embleya sp. NPDC050154]|uniref:2-keto-4-pentenoate hydratase n=1 Tax=Embleya sp. NPDC050154 TaxID=3363988 RepID=UPI0037928414